MPTPMKSDMTMGQLYLGAAVYIVYCASSDSQGRGRYFQVGDCGKIIASSRYNDMVEVEFGRVTNPGQPTRTSYYCSPYELSFSPPPPDLTEADAPFD